MAHVIRDTTTRQFYAGMKSVRGDTRLCFGPLTRAFNYTYAYGLRTLEEVRQVLPNADLELIDRPQPAPASIQHTQPGQTW